MPRGSWKLAGECWQRKAASHYSRLPALLDGTGSLDWRLCEFSTPASRRLASMLPITREACRKGMLKFSRNPSLCAVGGAG